jgi:hypothetical protein
VGSFGVQLGFFALTLTLTNVARSSRLRRSTPGER